MTIVRRYATASWHLLTNGEEVTDDAQLQAAVIQASIESGRDIVRRLFGTASSKLGQTYTYIFENFAQYLGQTNTKCSTIRTIINKDRSYQLDYIYVSPRYRFDDKEYADEYLIDSIRSGGRVVVIGLGGIGKTVFAKRCWLTISRNSEGKIPVFLELRSLNGVTEPDILAFIRHSISPRHKTVDEKVFLDFCNDGRFVFILDGFDEVVDRKKDTIERQIGRLADLYPDCGILVSSRDDDRFHGWDDFHIFRSSPFSREQLLELLGKVDFTSETKRKFTREIVERKYEEFQPFLSNPLLTLMMLMTFAQFAEVPDRRHIFYRYAFQTLHSWHDASKDAFKRESKTGLPIDHLEKLVAVFCLLSYLQNEYFFDDISLRERAGQAVSAVEFECNVEMFVREITESLNLLYRDGQSYVFIHRTFQEYFCAYAIVNMYSDRIDEIVPSIYSVTDNVHQLMYEINNDVVETSYIVPAYADVSEKLEFISKRRALGELADEMSYTLTAAWRTYDDDEEPTDTLRLRYLAPSPRYEGTEFVHNCMQFLAESWPSELKVEYPGANLPFSDIESYFRKKAEESNLNRARGVRLFYKVGHDEAYLEPYLLQPGDSNYMFTPGVDATRISVNGDEMLSHFLPLIQRAKAEVVFVKNAVEEIKRRRRKNRSALDTILN